MIPDTRNTSSPYVDWGISFLKNRRERAASLDSLARNYLLFTLVLFLLAGGVFALWNAWLLNVYQPADWPGCWGSCSERGQL